MSSKPRTSQQIVTELATLYVNGYIFLDRISWNNFNESGDS
jgi:hypothetical protein